MTDLTVAEVLERGADRVCANCHYIGIIYWDDGFKKTHHCMKSAERRRAGFGSCGDASEDFMSEFRKFYDATAHQSACQFYSERAQLGAEHLELLRAVEAAGKEGLVVGFFSRENRIFGELSGMFVDGGSFAFPKEPARGERRWFLTDAGKEALAREQPNA